MEHLHDAHGAGKSTPPSKTINVTSAGRVQGNENCDSLDSRSARHAGQARCVNVGDESVARVGIRTKAMIKRAIVALACHQVISAALAHRLLNLLGLRDA